MDAASLVLLHASDKISQIFCHIESQGESVERCGQPTGFRLSLLGNNGDCNPKGAQSFAGSRRLLLADDAFLVAVAGMGGAGFNFEKAIAIFHRDPQEAVRSLSQSYAGEVATIDMVKSKLGYAPLVGAESPA